MLSAIYFTAFKQSSCLTVIPFEPLRKITDSDVNSISESP